MARIFAYIVHRDGVVDDSAAELLAAARRIDATALRHCDCHRLGCGPRCRLQFASLFLRRDMEGRQRRRSPTPTPN